MHSKKFIYLLLAILLIKMVVQYFLIHPIYDLQRDEYLHLDQGRHLAWGYISVPPFTSWVSYIISLLGNGVFWVKFFPALFGCFTIAIVFKTIQSLGGNFFALLLGSLALLLSVLLRINILYQPNSFDIFFWTLLYYCIIRFIQTEDKNWMYAAAIALAFGIYSKYNILILLFGLAPALLFTPQRKLFLNKHFYFAAALCMVLIAPNFYWQVKNNFPTLKQLQELSDTQLVNVFRFDFLKNQFLYFFNSWFIWLAGLLALLLYKPFKKYRLIFWSYVFSIALFIFFKAKSYYAIGLYPILIAFGAVYFANWIESKKRKFMQVALLSLVVILSLPLFLMSFPVYTPENIKEHADAYKKLGMLRWEDGKEHHMPQDFADMLGWKDLAIAVDKAYDTLQKDGFTFVLCDNYGQAGAINYYSKFKNIQAVSFNADYINWMPLDKEIKNVILIQEANDTDPNRTKEKPFFEKVELAWTNNNVDSRERGMKVYVLQHAKIDVNKILLDEIKQRKK